MAFFLNYSWLLFYLLVEIWITYIIGRVCDMYWLISNKLCRYKRCQWFDLFNECIYVMTNVQTDITFTLIATRMRISALERILYWFRVSRLLIFISLIVLIDIKSGSKGVKYRKNILSYSYFWISTYVKAMHISHGHQGIIFYYLTSYLVGRTQNRVVTHPL